MENKHRDHVLEIQRHKSKYPLPQQTGQCRFFLTHYLEIIGDAIGQTKVPLLPIGASLFTSGATHMHGEDF